MLLYGSPKEEHGPFDLLMHEPRQRRSWLIFDVGQNMPQPLPSGLATTVNAKVLAHVENLSAHSDIAEVLGTAVKPLGDAQLFCPDWQKYRYVVVYTKGVIFGLAVGMDTIAFRLDPRMKSRALVTGAFRTRNVAKSG